MKMKLQGFHHRMARRLTGKTPTFIQEEDRWDYPPIEEVLEEAGLYTMEEYVTRRRNKFVDSIATRPIFELCQMAQRRSGTPYRKYWWDQLEVNNLLC